MPTTHRSPGETYAGYTQLEATTCCRCGVLFALPEFMLSSARAEGNFKVQFYCPNGHQQGFGTNQRERAEEHAKREADRAANLAAQRDQALASARAQKTAAQRARNERDKDRRRVANGVCPCCGRTFKQLARHMQTKHPSYVHEANGGQRCNV